jgi:hypothetical protein
MFETKHITSTERKKKERKGKESEETEKTFKMEGMK